VMVGGSGNPGGEGGPVERQRNVRPLTTEALAGHAREPPSSDFKADDRPEGRARGEIRAAVASKRLPASAKQRASTADKARPDERQRSHGPTRAADIGGNRKMRYRSPGSTPMAVRSHLPSARRSARRLSCPSHRPLSFRDHFLDARATYRR
jgi:hypothetical protein